MITIPEIAKTLEELREALNALDAEKARLENNVAELRSQLGLERLPSVAQDPNSPAQGMERHRF